MPLPVVWFGTKGKQLIRGTSTGVLCWAIQTYHGLKGERYLTGLGNTPDHITAICRELRSRTISRYMLALVNRHDPPPCHCGRPGRYIVGTTTYCEACKDRSEERAAVVGHVKEQRGVASSRQYEEYLRVKDAARKHRRARGQRTRPRR